LNPHLVVSNAFRFAAGHWAKLRVGSLLGRASRAEIQAKGRALL
jgi:hypothetical protein